MQLPQPTSGRVLIVEDDADIRLALRDALSDEGFEADVAGDGQAAIDYLRSHLRPSLILLDWNMAPMDGPRFMAELAKEPSFAGMPVALLSADAHVAAKAQSHGVSDYLKKPVDLESLFSVVARYCSPAASHRSR